MQDVSKDVKRAIDLIKKPQSGTPYYSNYCTSFIFGTENQEGINSVIDYNNKDVLTVASSGDQYLGALYYGAKKIDLYDINRLTKYVSYLKIAAVKHLSYQGFKDFFIPMDEQGKVKKSFWNLKTLRRLLPEMPNEVGFFWEQIMYAVKKDNYGTFVNLNALCNKEEMIVNGMPFYANEADYYTLQAKLRKRRYPVFRSADIYQLSKAFNYKYDIVYLSNIIETIVAMEVRKYPFAGYGTEDRIEGEVISVLEPEIYKVLKKTGTVMLSYRANAYLEFVPGRIGNFSTDYLYNSLYFEPTEIPRKLSEDSDEDEYLAKKDIVLTYKPSKTGRYV